MSGSHRDICPVQSKDKRLKTGMVDEWEKETEREEKGWNSSPVDVMFMT